MQFQKMGQSSKTFGRRAFDKMVGLRGCPLDWQPAPREPCDLAGSGEAPQRFPTFTTRSDSTGNATHLTFHETRRALTISGSQVNSDRRGREANVWYPTRPLNPALQSCKWNPVGIICLNMTTSE